MPWTDAARVFERCTGCGACTAACPQGIVATGRGGHPYVVFTSACTFCGACAAACGESVFDIGRKPPWTARAIVGPGCLEAKGIACRACEDACDVDAFRFRPQTGGRVSVLVDGDACTGCGGCVPVCPPNAIEVAHHG